jgi:hypothetical protein
MTTLTLQSSPPCSIPTVRIGEVFRISPLSLCYFGNHATDEAFACTFGKFKGYRGQQPDDFGMILGRSVHFALDADGRVAWAQLI